MGQAEAVLLEGHHRVAEEGIKMIKRLSKEILFLSLTIGGTLLVLITLSGSTLKKGIYISIVALVAHLIGVAIEDWQQRNE